MSQTAINLELVRSRIKDVCASCGRPLDSVKLLAVSKTFPASDISTAFHEGHQILFGENRVQELEEKVPALPAEIEWHLIGHLQSNKAAKAANLAAWIHSVDSEKLVNKLSSAAGEKILHVLLEVNTSGEVSKSGLHTLDELKKLSEKVLQCNNLKFEGLMTMAAPDAGEKVIRSSFASLRNMRDGIENEFRIKLPELSMGMSGDFEYAIMEGSTIVRIGSAIFGHR